MDNQCTAMLSWTPTYTSLGILMQMTKNAVFWHGLFFSDPITISHANTLRVMQHNFYRLRNNNSLVCVSFALVCNAVDKLSCTSDQYACRNYSLTAQLIMIAKILIQIQTKDWKLWLRIVCTCQLPKWGPSLQDISFVAVDYRSSMHSLNLIFYVPFRVLSRVLSPISILFCSEETTPSKKRWITWNWSEDGVYR